METIESLALTLQQKNRTELIELIRPIAHSETFHQVLKWPTEALRLYILDHRSQQDEARSLTQTRL
jgi:hypothetical protein